MPFRRYINRRMKWERPTQALPAIEFVISQTAGTPSSSFSGGVGYQFIVGASPITVTQLGRWVVAGNNLTHLMTLVNNLGTTLASVVVDTAGATSNTYLYGSISPYVLSAGGTYAILSNELSGGDQWLDNCTNFVTTSVATLDKYAYFPQGGSYTVVGNSSQLPGPVNFKYM